MDTTQSLREMLENADLFTAESISLHESLVNAVLADVQEALKNCEMPVFLTTAGFILAIHPSPKIADHWQVSRYTKHGAWGDSQHATLTQAITENNIDFAKRLSFDEAEQLIQAAILAQPEYLLAA